MELSTDLIKPNDEIVLTIWPARDSSPEALMDAFQLNGQERIVLQTTGNSNPPTNTVTITRPVCED